MSIAIWLGLAGFLLIQSMEIRPINEVALNCVDFCSFYGMIGTSAVAAIASGQVWLIPAAVGLAFFDSYQRTKDANRKIREIETYPDRWMKYCGVRLLAADLDTPLADDEVLRFCQVSVSITEKKVPHL